MCMIREQVFNRPKATHSVHKNFAEPLLKKMLNVKKSAYLFVHICAWFLA